MERGNRNEPLARVHEAAARRHGLVPLADLRSAGLSRPVIDRLVRDGWLRRLHNGVYLVGGAAPTQWQRSVAAWLAAGPASVVSHSSAAAVYGIPHLALDGALVPEVSVSGCHPRPAGVWVHRVSSLGGADVRKHLGVRITTPARTLVDLAGRWKAPLLARVVDEGTVARLWTPESIRAARRRAGRRRDLAVLDRVLCSREGTAAMDSLLEFRVERALRCLGPFQVHYQLVLGGRVVVLDLADPDMKLGVETDGWGMRGRSRGKFDSDRRRGNLLAAEGWTIVHLTSAMSDDEMRAAVMKVMLSIASRR